jgi:hypothetical protein
VQDAPLAALVRAADGKPAMVVARLWFAGTPTVGSAADK